MRTQEYFPSQTEHFYPSLFQNLIEKKFEIRTFFLLDRFYSMAIFSQQKESTSIDFRNYDVKNPNRYVPFSIPKSIESKLKLFMKKLDLKTGSIDLIVTPNDEYVFLEVNPVGHI